VRALKSGAYDYIVKPLDLDDIQAKVARAGEMRRLRAEVSSLRQAVHGRYSLASIVAVSPKMHEVIHQVRAVAGTGATVLILGESGTGKELVAHALHVEGRRAGGPFVAVNCGGFTETLLESELFGHERGAFTGAVSRHIGAFERADGGTLFLDEIGDAPASVQARLLRVLEEKEFMRVGGQSAVKVDARVVAASNRNLDDLVAEGSFREDLLYRLRVVTIACPPLRARPEDIRPLADRFVALACVEHGRRIESVQPGFYAALEKHDWPGNVRELRNVVESSVIMASGSVLSERDVNLGGSPKPGADEEPRLPPGTTLADLERTALLESLRRHEGNRTLAAQELGISTRTVLRKIKEHQLPF
jgi:two-component system response regulator AtoC